MESMVLTDRNTHFHHYPQVVHCEQTSSSKGKCQGWSLLDSLNNFALPLSSHSKEKHGQKYRGAPFSRKKKKEKELAFSKHVL